MQALLGSYRWDWKQLRDQLPGAGRGVDPAMPGDLIGPGIAIDETAQLKNGDATACVAPQHAGCTGTVENCVTTVFSAYVTANGQAWVDFDVYMPERWATDLPRRRAAGIPDDLEFATKPQLAMGQLDRLLRPGCRPGGPRSTRSTAAARRCARRRARPGPGLCGDHPVRLPASPCPPARRSGPIRPSGTRCSSAAPAGTAPRDPATATGP